MSVKARKKVLLLDSLVLFVCRHLVYGVMNLQKGILADILHVRMF